MRFTSSGHTVCANFIRNVESFQLYYLGLVLEFKFAGSRLQRSDERDADEPLLQNVTIGSLHAGIPLLLCLPRLAMLSLLTRRSL